MANLRSGYGEPVEPTVVRYPSGQTASTARVVATSEVGERIAVITDSTPFHPLDHTWPDQPADRGTLAGRAVVGCVTGAVGPDGELRLGADIPARRGDPGWTWVVVHLLETEPPPVGADVELAVDGEYRAALSAAHTACHLAALALNEATADLWRKEPPRRDSLGSPDLDGLAIERSTITPHRSQDAYRLGKSIRKRGLDTAALLADLDGLAQTVNRRLGEWIASGASVSIDTGGDETVAARRTWTCRLPDGLATYPCGGTHVASLADLPATTHVVYAPTESGFLAETIVA
jgi:alanyl-tRNA synthetase